VAKTRVYPDRVPNVRFKRARSGPGAKSRRPGKKFASQRPSHHIELNEYDEVETDGLPNDTGGGRTCDHQLTSDFPQGCNAVNESIELNEDSCKNDEEPVPPGTEVTTPTVQTPPPAYVEAFTGEYRVA
jgi:hypothetical protein